MNGHSCAFLLLEVFRLFPESEGVSGDVFEDVLGIGEVTRGAFVGIRKRVHLMPNLKGSPATDNCNRDIILKKVSWIHHFKVLLLFLCLRCWGIIFLLLSYRENRSDIYVWIIYFEDK